MRERRCIERGKFDQDLQHQKVFCHSQNQAKHNHTVVGTFFLKIEQGLDAKVEKKKQVSFDCNH